MMKKLLSLLLACMLGLSALAGCKATAPEPAAVASAPAAISFTDDEGRQITLEKPSQRIITLYSAHAENLYSLGAGERVIGAHSTCVYPPAAAFLPRFDYNADPEKVIAANPDCVLIRPFITNKSPDFVKALENAGITVVSLYPERLDEFDFYIERLALLTGTEKTAQKLLAEFHEKLDDIQKLTANLPQKQRIFFESTEVNLRTATPDSMAGLAITMAGGENVAAEAEPVSVGSSIASFGAEKILALADQIDVYVSQRGAMNAGGNLHSISIRPGFDTIKAIKDGRVYVINEKLISSPTFRFDKGVTELARYLYPDRMDDLAGYRTDVPATKRDFANILVRAEHLPVYVPSSSKYYAEKHIGHVYGLFEDVTWQDPDFDYIETAATSGAIGWTAKDGRELYLPEAPVTREELAKAIFILRDYSAAKSPPAISDLADCENQNIVQSLVENRVFDLNDGRFEPKRVLTCREIVETLESLPQER